jgi:Lon-like protease
MDPASPVTLNEPSQADDVSARFRAPHRYPKWPFVLVAALLLLGTSLVVAWPINLPYYSLSPGPAYNVDDFVSVDTPADDGDLLFLTVSLDEVNVLEALAGWIDPRIDLRPRETIRPSGVSQEELRRQNLALMDSSKENAVYVALTYLGYEVTYEEAGAEVNTVMEGTAADGVLEKGDVIVGVDGEQIANSSDLVALVSELPAGAGLTIEYRRPIDAANDEWEDMSVPITLGPHTDDADRGMIGVVVGNAGDAVFPLAVEIDSQNIGGPSAGLMFTLEIIDLLTPGPLTKGARVAGTGTIDREGNVGAIGGIRQKVYGAIDAGAGYILVPAGNYDDAVDAAGDDITVVKVETFRDAIALFESLPD